MNDFLGRTWLVSLSSDVYYIELTNLLLKDELFHVPQAQHYCLGNFTHWDPMITTFPGLYEIHCLSQFTYLITTSFPSPKKDIL